MAGETDTERKERIVATGTCRAVEYARRRDRSLPAKLFFDSLPKVDQAKMLAPFQLMANQGETAFNKAKFRRLEDDLYEFKSDAADGRMIRFGCVRRDRRWLLLHGCYKPAQQFWQQSDVNQCHVVRDEHIACFEDVADETPAADNKKQKNKRRRK